MCGSQKYKATLSHIEVKSDYTQRNRTGSQTLLATVEQHGLGLGPAANRRTNPESADLLEMFWFCNTLRSKRGVLDRKTRGGTMSPSDGRQWAKELSCVDLYKSFGYDNETVVLASRRPFDRSCLIRQFGIRPKSKRPTEGARVCGGDKQDFKTYRMKYLRAFKRLTWHPPNEGVCGVSVTYDYRLKVELGPSYCTAREKGRWKQQARKNFRCSNTVAFVSSLEYYKGISASTQLDVRYWTIRFSR